MQLVGVGFHTDASHSRGSPVADMETGDHRSVANPPEGICRSSHLGSAGGSLAA
jgi:hypothetical protein